MAENPEKRVRPEVVWCPDCDNTADVSCTIEHGCYEAVVLPKSAVEQVGIICDTHGISTTFEPPNCGPDQCAEVHPLYIILPSNDIKWENGRP